MTGGSDTTSVAGRNRFLARARTVLDHLDSTGQLKRLRRIEGPMGPRISMDGVGEVDCFCSNNYLGLANHPKVVDAGIEGLRRYGAGTASVRFICGTFAPHDLLETRIAEFLGVEKAYTFVSCWNATEAIFPTLCEPGDAIVSEELNHACIIDSVRLAGAIRKGVTRAVYAHSDMAALADALAEVRSPIGEDGVTWVVTDGVFSMEGDLANLPAIRALCDEYDAMLVVDDSHGTGVMGATGRGTHEHFGMAGHDIDLFTGTLGKALGGGAGGYVAGRRDAVDLIIQRGRPTLFSNALPITVACSADRAIKIVQDDSSIVETLHANVARARTGIREVGYEILDSPTAICPIMIGDTAEAISMSNRLLERGVFVIGFGHPVVPEGTARLRIQISAAHRDEHLDRLFSALAAIRP